MTGVKARVLYAVGEEEEFLRLRSLICDPKDSVVLEWVPEYHDLIKALLADDHDLYIIDETFDSAARVPDLEKADVLERGLPIVFLTADSPNPRILHMEADYFVRDRFSREDLNRALRYAHRQKSLRAAVSCRLIHQRLTNSILSLFVGVEAHELDACIQQALESLGRFASVDRCYLWQFAADGLTMQKTHQWRAEGAAVQYRPGSMISVRELPWLVSRVRQGRTVTYADIANLPAQAERELSYFMESGVRAIAIVPLLRRENVVGFLGVSSVSTPRVWDEDLIELLQTTGRVFINILARRSAEEARRHSDVRFRSLIESLNDGLVLLDERGRIEYVNERFCSLAGYGRTEASGKRLFELLHVSNEKREGPPGEAPAAGPRSAADRFQIVRKDGVKRWINITSAPYRHTEGAAQGAVALLTDVTEQQELEAQLRQSQKMEAVGRLAGGVAHDFNNFLTAVLGYSGLLLHRLPAEHPNRHELLQIRKAGEQAGTLVNQLLTFSRKQVVTPKVLSLNTVVEETARMLKRLIGEDIELLIDLNPSLRRVRADPGQMQQIILNLAINARDAMPEGGTLRVVTENHYIPQPAAGECSPMPAGDYVTLSVADTGCGIADHVKAHLFEPFFTTKEQGKGTGLGLSTVYGIVKSGGGYIAVKSELGQGAVFQIFLPSVDAPVETQPCSSIKENLRGGSETILLVEDEDSVRNLLSEILRLSGYQVLAATDGRDAVKLSRTFDAPIQLMVTDVVMPYMGGRQAAELVCQDRPETRLLIISGYLHDAAVPKMIADRPCAFLSKPFSPFDFCAQVRQVLDRDDRPEEAPPVIVSEKVPELSLSKL